MAFGDQLKNWFKKNPQDSVLDSGLSLGMPDASMYGASIQPVEPAAPSRSAPAPASTPSTASPAPASAEAPADLSENAPVRLPLLGSRPVSQHQRILSVLLALALAVLIGVTLLNIQKSDQTARQLESTGQALMQSQRLAKAVQQALAGDADGFTDAADSARVLTQQARGLLTGNAELNLQALSVADQGTLEKITPLLDRVEQNTATIMAQRKALTSLAQTLRQTSEQSAKLLELAQAVASQKLQQGAPQADVAAAHQLVMLTQRLAKSGNEFLSLQGASQPTLALLGQDLRSFRQLAAGLLDGHAALGLAPTADAATRERLNALLKLFDDTAAPASAQLDNLAGLASARAAQSSILSDAEVLRQQLGSLQAALSSQSGLSVVVLLALTLAAILAVLSVIGLSYAQLLSGRQRQAAAEALQLEAQRQEQEAKRVNDATQAAILRLMNELQAVAEGDLTQEATVTEDITGAIADSVNYTVEELRSLVGNVQNTAARVAATTAEVDMTSTELLAASNEQLHEIRETGRSVVDMAGRINQVSAQAQASADVARQSLQAATVGLQAVQDAMGGMNTIRGQIQDTAKRIKRLGESSQEIGEITELISDITEQTNVLALNAAIQAASAGDAGRGFSVVAQEVQRLAERSADATRQIAALVKAIQTDTQDAVGAMERSTQGVVEGARLSDNAGTALTEIDQVSRRLAELIEQISDATSREANQANEVAENIQHIFAVTEQTGEGTRSTAAQVRELAKVAEELRQSVARFRIA